MSIVLVGFALLMVIPALSPGDTWARVPRVTSCPACASPSGAVIAVGGSSLPWAPAPLDFGRDAVTVLGLSAGLYLLGVAMLPPPSSASRRLRTLKPPGRSSSETLAAGWYVGRPSYRDL